MNKFAHFTNNDLWHYLYSNSSLSSTADGRDALQELSIRLYGMNSLYEENIRMRAFIADQLSMDDDEIDDVISSMVEVKEETN